MKKVLKKVFAGVIASALTVIGMATTAFASVTTETESDDLKFLIVIVGFATAIIICIVLQCVKQPRREERHRREPLYR